MKRCLTWLLFMLLLPFAVLAEEKTQIVYCKPGSDVDVVFSLTEDSDRPDVAVFRLEYDTDALELLPNRAVTAQGVLWMYDGKPVTLHFRVRSYAPAGEYRIVLTMLDTSPKPDGTANRVHALPVRIIVGDPAADSSYSPAQATDAPALSDAGEQPADIKPGSLRVARFVTPEIAHTGQWVRVTYELTNTGEETIGTIKVQEKLVKNAKTVRSLAAGATMKVEFTAKMGSEDLTSGATITFRPTSESPEDSVTVEDVKIPLAVKNLSATLSADKTEVNIGDTVTLTLVVRNEGNITYSDVTATDKNLGQVFEGLTIPAGGAISQEKTVTITSPSTFQLKLNLNDNTGMTNTYDTNQVTISAYDPEKELMLTLLLSSDKESLVSPPEDVPMSLVVTNSSNVDCKKIQITHAGVQIYTIPELLAGQSVTVKRDYTVSQAGQFRFMATTKDPLGNTVSFESNTLTLQEKAPVTPLPVLLRGAKWPVPQTEGWDVIDLSSYPVNTGRTVSFSRETLETGGLMVVNRWHPLPADYTDDRFANGDELVSISNAARADSVAIQVYDARVCLMRPAYEALRDMLTAARADGVDYITIREGYRPNEKQTQLFLERQSMYEDRYTGETLVEKTREKVSVPGTSDFQTGLSVRVYRQKKGDSEFNSIPFRETEQFRWLYDHSWEYGYVFRFPVAGYPVPESADKSWKTGMPLQMMVFRYVGIAPAAVMHIQDWCLEEFVEYMTEHPHIAVYQDGVLRYELYRVPDTGANITLAVPSCQSVTASIDNLGGVIVSLTYQDGQDPTAFVPDDGSCLTAASQLFWKIRHFAAFCAARLNYFTKDWEGVLQAAGGPDPEALAGAYPDYLPMWQEAAWQVAENLYTQGRDIEAYRYYKKLEGYRDVSTAKLTRQIYKLFGTWTSASGDRFVFREDGTCEINGERLYYAAHHYQLKTGENPDDLNITYQLVNLRDTTLTLQGSSKPINKKIFRLTRVNNADE